MSQLFASGDQSIGVSSLTSLLPRYTIESNFTWSSQFLNVVSRTLSHVKPSLYLCQAVLPQRDGGLSWGEQLVGKENSSSSCGPGVGGWSDPTSGRMWELREKTQAKETVLVGHLYCLGRSTRSLDSNGQTMPFSWSFPCLIIYFKESVTACGSLSGAPAFLTTFFLIKKEVFWVDNLESKAKIQEKSLKIHNLIPQQK